VSFLAPTTFILVLFCFSFFSLFCCCDFYLPLVLSLTCWVCSSSFSYCYCLRSWSLIILIFFYVNRDFCRLMQTGPCDFIHVFWDSIRMILLTTFVLTQALLFPVSAHIQAVSVPDEIQDKLNVILRKEFIVHVRGRFFLKGTTTSEWWELSFLSSLVKKVSLSLSCTHGKWFGWWGKIG